MCVWWGWVCVHRTIGTRIKHLITMLYILCALRVMSCVRECVSLSVCVPIYAISVMCINYSHPFVNKLVQSLPLNIRRICGTSKPSSEVPALPTSITVASMTFPNPLLIPLRFLPSSFYLFHTFPTHPIPSNRI